MFWNRHDVLMLWISFVILICETCCGNNNRSDGCYAMSKGIDMCFSYNTIPREFASSRKYCLDNDGFLLEIQYQEIQTQVEAFCRKVISFFQPPCWLNLVRKNGNVWVWGGEGTENYSYSNWENPSPLATGISNAILSSNYKWVNSYDITKASTICIKGKRETYFPGTKMGSPSPSSSSPLSSSAVIGIGVGVGLGGLVLIIVSSLLIAKFVFHKEIPLPFKFSRCRNSPLHETGSDVSRAEVIYDGYEQIDESKIDVIKSLSGPRATYAEVIVVPDPHEPQTKNYYNNNVNNNSNNNSSNSSNKKVLEYADLGSSNPNPNSKQEPERIAAPDGTLYTKTFEKEQNENLTTD